MMNDEYLNHGASMAVIPAWANLGLVESHLRMRGWRDLLPEHRQMSSGP